MNSQSLKNAHTSPAIRHEIRQATKVAASPGPDSNAAAPWLVGNILIFPLFRSGQPALAVLILELLSVLC